MVSIRKAKQKYSMSGMMGMANGKSNGFKLRDRRSGQMMLQRESLGLIAGGFTIGILLILIYHTLGFNDTNGEMYGGASINSRIPENLRNTHPHPHLHNEGGGAMNDSFNAIAKDILDTLDCASLFKISTSDNPEEEVFGRRRTRRRRLDEEEDLAQQHGDDGGFLEPPPENGGDFGDVGGGLDDDVNMEGGGEMEGEVLDDDVMNGEMAGEWNYVQVTAKHLFCVAAYDTRAPKEITDQLQCDAEKTKRQTLLDLWSAARAQFPSTELLVKVLETAKEQNNQLLLDRMYHLWAPDLDDGLSFMLNSLNDENDMEHGIPVRNLKENLLVVHDEDHDGPVSSHKKKKLFVDVGSCLGLTTLCVNHLYPGTKIVSIEPAHPNWLLQELNLRCNLRHDELRNIHVILGGVGPNTEDEDSLMGKVLWRPKATTSTRAWTPKDEHGDDDVELIIKLRRLSSLLAEANVYGQPIDVLHVDCEGCEYNLIPAMTEEEFDAIPAVIGGVHWYVQ